MNPLFAMFRINAGWLVILLGFLVVYLSMRRKRQPAPTVATTPPAVEDIPSVLPADGPRCHHNPLRNPKFSRPPLVGVFALTMGGIAVLFCLLLLSVTIMGASSQATFVSYGGPVVPNEAGLEAQLVALERMQQVEEARLRQQQQQAQQRPGQQVVQADLRKAVQPPRVEPPQPKVEQEPLPAPRTEPVAAAVPLPQPLQPAQPQPKGKTINPTRTSAARSQVIVVEGEYQKAREAAWRSALEHAQIDVQEYLRQRGMRIEVRVPRELIENKMLKGEPKEEVRDFGGNVGEMRRFVLELQVTPEVRTVLAQQDREFRAQERMLLVGKVLALVVVLLAATALYFRLDEYTKGYYTSSLRWAALGVVAGFIVFLIFGS